MWNLCAVLSLFISIPLFAADAFPTSPDAQLTPGSLCQRASKIRYPEQIAYCSRDVKSGLKRQVIDTYDHDLGFTIMKTGREHFKIDHYIPLCMGGSNEADNLWPQHESIYQYTDPLEPIACQKMAEGKLLQADAIEIIKKAKANPPETSQYIQYLQDL
ncbi:HNH endonuclease signature motif containing protein [Bdellovibrionota bacterium FG-2]